MHTIASLNDALRTTFIGGRVMLTDGFMSLAAETQAKALDAVRSFDSWTEDNDPYKERDFGSVKIDGHTVFWKMAYYDNSLEYGSEDPANPAVTTRVLTIMLSHEW